MNRAREGEWPTIAYALLAVLARGETTGYQLARFMDKPVGLFWQAPHSQIYPQLAALERGGMVTSSAEPGPGPRARKTYAVTDAGRALLRDWVATRPEPRAVRDEMVLRSYAAWTADRAEAAALFRAEQTTHEQRLAELEQMAENLTAKHGARLGDPAEPIFGNWAALQRGLGAEREYVRWCTWMAEQLGR
jgi:DNA-binding PadR family transcriptional regulator